MPLQIFTAPLAQLGLAVLAGSLLSLAVSPLAIGLARRLGLMDIPGTSPHKRHAAPTPLAGGMILMICLPILLTVFGLWQKETAPLLGAAGIIFLFGLLDDRFGFSAAQKFSGQGLASLLILWSGISVNFFDVFLTRLPAPLIHWLNLGVTVFWLVGIVNAFNLTDSMDGLAAGLAAIAAGFSSLFALAAGQTELAQISAILFGICLGLYAINITPARSFLGDSGAQTLGFLLAVIGILYTPPQAPQGSTWFIPILLVGVPIFDTTLVTFSRLRRGKPVFQADLGHTYHRLVRAGLSARRAVLTLQLTAFALGSLAFLSIFLPPRLASGLFALACLSGLLGMLWLEFRIGLEE
ncbi:MAG: hypothetical protein OHK0031_03350 [Anaerolineales bacterium]